MPRTFGAERKNMTRKIISMILGAALALSVASVQAFAMTSGTNVEEKVVDIEEIIGITPKGNLTLVDDLDAEDGKISPDYSENLKLITVKTKSDDIFYIVIDKTKDTDNVYFLNLVDNADLMAVLEGTEVEYTPICTCRDRCESGKGDRNCPVCKNDPDACEGIETVVVPEGSLETPEPEKNAGVKIPVVPIIVVLVLAGGAFWYVKFGKDWLRSRGTDDAEKVAEYADDDDREYRE